VKDPDNEAKPKACYKDTKSQRKAQSFHRKERHDAKQKVFLLSYHLLA
jgi:hypothetical protein